MPKLTAAVNLIERFFSPRTLAERLDLSPDFIRDYFHQSPDILLINRPETRFKRAYSTMRIPESAVQRMIAELRKRR